MTTTAAITAIQAINLPEIRCRRPCGPALLSGLEVVDLLKFRSLPVRIVRMIRNGKAITHGSRSGLICASPRGIAAAAAGGLAIEGY